MRQEGYLFSSDFFKRSTPDQWIGELDENNTIEIGLFNFFIGLKGKIHTSKPCRTNCEGISSAQ